MSSLLQLFLCHFLMTTVSACISADNTVRSYLVRCNAVIDGCVLSSLSRRYLINEKSRSFRTDRYLIPWCMYKVNQVPVSVLFTSFNHSKKQFYIGWQQNWDKSCLVEPCTDLLTFRSQTERIQLKGTLL